MEPSTRELLRWLDGTVNTIATVGTYAPALEGLLRMKDAVIEHIQRDAHRIAELTNDRDEALYRVRELENQLRIEREKGGLR